MAKTVIVSDDTARRLIEAYASLAAWFYQLSEAARRAGAGVSPPSDAQRKAYAEQAGALFPELAAVAAGVAAPRPFIPPPAIAAAPIGADPPPDAVALRPNSEAGAAAIAVPPPAVVAPAAALPRGLAPPPIVDPTKVRY